MGLAVPSLAGCFPLEGGNPADISNRPRHSIHVQIAYLIPLADGSIVGPNGPGPGLARIWYSIFGLRDFGTQHPEQPGISGSEARRRIDALVRRCKNGEDFAVLAGISLGPRASVFLKSPKKGKTP